MLKVTVAEAQRLNALFEKQDDPELAKLIRLWAKRVEDEAQTSDPLATVPFLDSSAIFAPQPPIPWLCRRLAVAPGAPCCLVGRAGVGKSAIGQDLVLSLASGRPFLRTHPVTRTRVLHLDMDQGIDQTRRRYVQQANARGITASDLAGWLFLGDPSETTDWTLATEHAERHLVDLVKRLDVGFVFIDSLKPASGGIDENSSDSRSVLDLLRRVSSRTGCATLCLHHTRKAQVGQDEDSDDMGRGTSAFKDALSSYWIVSGKDQGDLTMRNIKSRPCRKPESLVVKLEGDGGDDSPLYVVEVDVEASRLARESEEASKLESDLLGTLAGTGPVRQTELLAHLKINANSAARRKLFLDTMLRLVKDGRVKCWHEGRTKMYALA